MSSRGTVDPARIARLEASTRHTQTLEGRWQATPNIIEFAMSYLGVDLYPRQATLLKLIFCAADLMTDFDRRVIEEWTTGFELRTQTDGSAGFVGNYGTTPDVLNRIDQLRNDERRWFREVVLVAGRRSSKGLIGAISTAFILWQQIHSGDPQRDLGLPRGKQVHVLVFAAQHQQAHENQYRDVAELIRHAECFKPYLGQVGSDTISLYSAAQLKQPAAPTALPAFVVSAREATTNAGRGQASLVQLYDEMAHINATGANRSADEIYSAASPGTTQFPKLAFLFQASSPWSQTGKFYAQYQRALAVDPIFQRALDPDMLVVQLPSHDLYRDWELTQDETLAWPGGVTFRPLAGPIFSGQDEARLRRADPATYDVEYGAQWATAQAAYLPREDIDRLFAGFRGCALTMRATGTSQYSYTAHADPSRSGANFALVVAHAELDPEGGTHVIIDLVQVWEPRRFPDHRIDYEEVNAYLEGLLRRFKITELSFDQYNSAGLLDRLKAFAIGDAQVLGRPVIYEKTATAGYNRRVAETFKTALARGLVHAPQHDLAEQELRFLEERNGKVDHPSSGPVRTSDIADCLMAVVDTLLGDGNGRRLGQSLGNLSLRVSGRPPSDDFVQDRRRSGPGAARGNPYSPSRGPRRNQR